MFYYLEYVPKDSYTYWLSRTQDTKLKDQVIALQQILKSNPLVHDNWLFYARALIQKEDYFEAEEAFDMALKILPYHVDTQLEKVSLYLQMDLPDKAIQIMELLQNRLYYRSDRPHELIDLAFRIAEKTKSPSWFETYSEKIINEKDEYLQERLGDIWFQAGNKARAKVYYLQATQNSKPSDGISKKIMSCD